MRNNLAHISAILTTAAILGPGVPSFALAQAQAHQSQPGGAPYGSPGNTPITGQQGTTTYGGASYGTPYSSGLGFGSDGGYSGGGTGNSSRSVFLSIFAANFIPGIANGLSKWFTGRIGNDRAELTSSSGAVASEEGPSGEGGVTPATSPRPVVSDSLAVAKDAVPVDVAHAGFAFRVQLITAEGSRSDVDPTRQTFSSGQQFELSYRTNLPGRVVVFNLDPRGQEREIDRVELQAGELNVLGPYEFVDATGEDTLRLVFQPCIPRIDSGRGIAKVAMVREDVARAIGKCQPEASADRDKPTRSIVKVTRDTGTHFALDRLTDEELRTGAVAPRETRIVFQHR